MRLYISAKAVIIRDDKVLLLREGNYNEGNNEGKWDVPGGRLENDETLMEGLSREVKEECGLRIVPGELIGVIENFPTIKGEDCHVIRHYYRAMPETAEVVLSSDHDRFEWVKLTDLAKNNRVLVPNLREIIDNMSILKSAPLTLKI